MSAMVSHITSDSIVYSTVCSSADQRKHQSSASLAFVREIHRWPVNSPHKGPVTRKMFPFDDVIMRGNIWITTQQTSLSTRRTTLPNIIGLLGWVFIYLAVRHRFIISHELSILKPSYRCEIWLSRRQPNIKTIRKFVTKMRSYKTSRDLYITHFTSWINGLIPIIFTETLLVKVGDNILRKWPRALLWETSSYFKSSCCKKKDFLATFTILVPRKKSN